MRRCVALSFTIVLFLVACAHREIAPDQPPVPVLTLDGNAQPASVETEQQSEYPGISIDQRFPILSHYSLIDENGREVELVIPVDGYVVKVKDYVPRTLDRNGKPILNFKNRQKDGYWGTLLGVSNLLGSNSKQIYIAVSGPGGVCCTNYSIVDISSETPRTIFHSEDFGGFRDAMEVFDAENDGVYELVQFDSAFRYFMDDCGSCSPEPRAVFKYDKKSRTYLPAAGIQQDFVKESFGESEKWIIETFQKVKKTGDIVQKFDLRRSLIAHVVDLLYFGDEQKAWKTFDTYFPTDLDKEETRRELKKRLKEAKFYRFIHNKDET